jgi:hypothetical protein
MIVPPLGLAHLSAGAADGRALTISKLIDERVAELAVPPLQVGFQLATCPSSSSKAR